MKKWKTLATEMAFDHKWFKVRRDTVELPNGEVLDDYYVWPSNDVAMIAPVTPDNQFVLVKQYKHAVGEIMIEFPAGYVEAGEDVLATARRELTEETGYTAQELVPLATFANNPTKEISKVFAYLATECEPTAMQNLDSTEDIEVLTVSFSQMLHMIQTGEVWNTGTIASTYLALEKLGKLAQL